MRCRSKPVRTWYDLIRACLEEAAAQTVLDSGQIQALLARLKKEAFFLRHKTKRGGCGSLSSEQGREKRKKET